MQFLCCSTSLKSRLKDRPTIARSTSRCYARKTQPDHVDRFGTWALRGHKHTAHRFTASSNAVVSSTNKSSANGRRPTHGQESKKKARGSRSSVSWMVARQQDSSCEGKSVTIARNQVMCCRASTRCARCCNGSDDTVGSSTRCTARCNHSSSIGRAAGQQQHSYQDVLGKLVITEPLSA